jgi:hypothetical protein
MEIAEPEVNGPSNAADAPVMDDPTPNSDIDSTAASTVLVEVLPGVAVVFGEVPAELKPDLIDFGLVPSADVDQLSTILASIGNAATVGGNLGSIFSSAQGLYKLSDGTRALLNAGARLAVKDGANLGAVLSAGSTGRVGIIGQARFVPLAELRAARIASAVGPALAMIGLQMQLSEITGLVRTNIALTSQVLTTIRNEQWAELTGLVAAIDRALDQAREVGSVPASLWDSVAGSKAALHKQLLLYRLNVRGHIGHIERTGPRRREYLQTNAEAILFDTYALLSSVKAWTGYQRIHAGMARAAGEAELVDIIARDSRTELDSALAETTSLVDSLTRELRIIAELPGRDTLAQSLPGKRKDSKAARQTSADLLEAIKPLADALRAPLPPLAAPDVVCAPESLELEPYLRILRWLLDDGETLRVLGFPEQLDALGSLSVVLGGAKEKLAAAMDRAPAKTLVAITDRRIITAKTNTFLEQGEVLQHIPIDRVRYVRAATTQDKSARLAIDLITRDENIRWLFHTDLDNAQVDALAAVLAESMTIPDVERDELQRGDTPPAGPTALPSSRS